MGIQDLSENTLLVDPSPEPSFNEELANVTDVVRERGDCDVIIDFKRVDIVTSSSLSKLLKLRKLLIDCNHTLVLCSVAMATKGIFSVTALDGVFTMVSNQAEAQAAINAQTANLQL